ncbi:hypothetical protein M3182_10920 [Mesobacillus maritimus]|uniref:hypothetical protein n=1 Tax=Mesobacillus maritimus TaxID=1643336 RepID=UPI00203B31EE|nr:hypothetical protein [Mesobacillus maritimus]MCM3586242.1 hypothetical protein [Mesobacillus maritimus]MCM3667569.1 hypothetical protein [Mesobacillus maritimus]
MSVEDINDILDRLKSGELTEYRVLKADFLAFRQVLVNRKDFKNFRGIAQRGGDVIYQYLQTPRS